MLVDSSEGKVTSFKTTKYDLATAYVDTVDEKGSCLFFLLDQEGYDFEVLE